MKVNINRGISKPREYKIRRHMNKNNQVHGNTPKINIILRYIYVARNTQCQITLSKAK